MRIRVGLVSIFVAGAACGGSSPTSYNGGNNPPASPPPGAQVVNVSMTDNGGAAPYAFSPPTLTVKVGSTVKWTDNGSTSHTTTSDATPAMWDRTLGPSGSPMCDPNGYNCQPGSAAGTYEFTFSAAGTYPYHCAFHRAQGMTGTITVTP